MSKFDTNGGHYEPLGYMRVNAGGSHEENPNGGVQVGMDEEGTPNLLEEGEPVYNDYVYSDNITADEEILKKHNVPTKYAGKLYSKIADSYVDEAAETPLDPISNNGLNAMLVRLADAQEEQKVIQQQKELEEELANMSPEELEELEAMLSTPEVSPEVVAPTEMEMPVLEQSVQPGMQMPMMAAGGNLFRLGNPLTRRTHYRSVQWPYTNAYNQFDIPIYDGTDEPITSIRYGNGLNYLAQPNTLSNETALKTDTVAGQAAGKKDAKRHGASVITTPIDRTTGYILPNLSGAYQPTLGYRDENGRLIKGVPGGVFLSHGVPYSDLQGNTQRPIVSSRYNDITLDVGPTPGNPNVTYSGINGPSVAAAQAVAARSAAGVSGAPAAKAASVAVNPNGGAGADSNMLPTWPRYAGALTAGILGLHNAFQEPDKYEIPAYQPVLPQGRMDLIDPVYNPIDQNMAVNNLLASSAGTTRAITNSGLGTGAPATLLAQDYNTGRNIGAAQTQIWDANNQRRNDVIARRNQNAATLGQFNYGQSRDRAAILNDAAWRNLQNEITQQRLNYASENQKYAAIQQQIDSVADALSKIGYENAAMNMVNGDDAYAYALNRLFDTYYKGNKAACGGKIKKTKK